jgi:hypothetical protein
MMAKSRGNTKPRGLQMNEKRRKLLKAIGQGKTFTEASEDAGYSHRQSGAKAFALMKMQVPDIISQQGMPIAKLLRKLVQKTEAKETQFFANKGIVLDSRRVVSHDIQLRAIDMLAKLYGIYPKQEENGGRGPESTRITLNLAFVDPGRAATVFEAARESASGSDLRQPVLVEKCDQDS